MNFLSGGYVEKYKHFCLCLKVHCCRDTNKTILNSNIYQQMNSYKPEQSKSLLCLSGARINRLLWTQVRYQKDFPKIHRDIEQPNFDEYRKERFKNLKSTSWRQGDEKYGYTYVVGCLGAIFGMYALKADLIHLLSSMSAPADVLAMATIELNISNIAPGACVSYKWRGKPLFIKHRTTEDIQSEANTPMSALRDPETPEQRTIKQEWLVVIGICTHLGCVPVPNSGDWAGGFYCPCHGSHYDNVGRTRKGPAPTNLEVPPYKFLSDTVVLVG